MFFTPSGTFSRRRGKITFLAADVCCGFCCFVAAVPLMFLESRQISLMTGNVLETFWERAISSLYT